MIAVAPHLIVVVGCAGSGKTRYLSYLKEEGSIQEHLEDYLEALIDLEQNIRQLKSYLGMGSRIGICGKSFREMYRRILLERGLDKVVGLEIEWIFFEPDIKACLENIIKDGLAGKGSAKERVRSVLAIAEGATFDIPRNATVLGVVGQEVTGREIARFFRKFDFGPDHADVERKVIHYLKPTKEA